MDAKETAGEPRLLISRPALLHNVRVIRRHLAPGVKLCAMIKANAYGHGAGLVADTLCNFALNASATAAWQTPAAAVLPAVDQLAVATIDEAAELPPTDLPVLILRPVENIFLGRQREAIELAVRRGWTLTVASGGAADDIARRASACGVTGKLHVMVDTGLTRCGAPTDSLWDLLRRIDNHASLKLMSLGTHFASSEMAAEPFNAEQLRRFHAATDTYVAARAAAGIRVPRHAANSGAIFFNPESHLDMVRPGISLYGIDPTGRPSIERPLRPVARWTAPLLSIRDVAAGTSVGYGQLWTAPRPARIGLVPIGYADGYPRSYTNNAAMLLDGRRAPVVGRVSMDLTVVDLSQHPQATVGDEMIVMDSDPLSPVSAYNLAEWDRTIAYEVFCRIGTRIKRVSLEPEKLAPEAEEWTDDFTPMSPPYHSDEE